MRVIKQLKNHSPYFNMAVDEYFLQNEEDFESVFIINQNESSVIIGRNQNPLEEINLEFAKNNNIKICRRISGGGAVYHDMGNISFTFIENYDSTKTYEYFSKKIISILNEMGISAKFHGRNDILIDDQKISGNAQAIFKSRIMHHGTLLFSVNLENLKEVLTPHFLKISSRAIKSNKSRVTLIKNYYKNASNTIFDFAQDIIDTLLKDHNNKLQNLSDKEIKKIKEIAINKYEKNEWIYKESITYDYKNKKKFSGGLIELNLNAAGNKIKKVEFVGDFLSRTDVQEIEKKLVDKQLTFIDLYNVFNAKEFENYFGSISIEEIISLFPII